MIEYQIDSNCIYNVDEKGFLIGQVKNAKHVISRPQYQRGSIEGVCQPGDRQWVTVIAGVCVDGTSMPPALIYQGAGNLQSTWPQSTHALLRHVPRRAKLAEATTIMGEHFSWTIMSAASVSCQSSNCPSGNPPSKLECPTCSKSVYLHFIT